MIKNILFVVSISLLAHFEIYADWVPVDENKTANTPPQVTLLSDDNSSTILKIDIAGFNLNEFVSEGKSYQSVDLLSEMLTTNPGHPELSYIAKVLAIPNQGGISVEVIETSEVQTFSNIYLAPARESWFEGNPESPYNKNSKAYLSEEIYPKEFAEVEPPSVFRDFRIARVSVFPLRYIPASNELQAVSSITVRINYNPGESVNPKTSTKKQIAPSFGKLYRNFIFNYENVLNKLYGGKETGYEVMLCIMPDEFAESFQIYADWKHRSGTNIHITKFSDIGANSNNPDIIKNHITDAYNNWENPPTYVLIVGDDGVFPKKIVSYGYSFPNEDFFVEIEGNDYFPEMMIGRLTNQGDYRLQVLLKKFMLYEQMPYTEDTSWFKKGICCSNNAYASQISTKRFTAALMTEDGGFTVDTLMSDGWGSGCSMNTDDVLGALNEGRSYLNYRGEGWSTGWWAACYDMNTSAITSLTNGEKFTFVTSIGCGVAMFNTGGGNCFGEEWIELGSLTAPRGCIGFVGPTSNTHTTYNNKIDKGIYTGMFQENMDTPGQALLRGKLYMYNVFGNVYNVEYHYRVYCVLGDPSLHIWKEVPLAVNVDHETTIVVGDNQLEFTATFATTGLPVANAEFCLAGNTIYEVDSTDTSGKVIFNISPDEEEVLTITLIGGNVVPYMGSIDVIQPLEQVGPDGNPQIVDLDGNTDGLINPNENCNVTFTLKNWGTLTASNVQASLSAVDPNFVQVISTEQVSFGTLAPGGSFTGDPFQIFVKPTCPVGQIITLQLHVTSNTTTWDHFVDAEVTGCNLMYKNFLVNDEGTANVNYRMDPGETVNLVFSIMNIGEDIAPDVKGILTSDDPYITIQDSIGSFGLLNINDEAINTQDYFVVNIDAACPTEYLADFALKLYTQNGNYPYQTIPYFSLPVALPIPGDYTGPDAYGYYAYSNEDSFYDKTPVYDWFEIEGLGSQISVPEMTDYTETVDLPFTFKYYGINYDNLRISTDGWIAFGGGPQIAPLNAPLPSNDNVNSMVAVFWDDLYDIEYSGEGEIYYYNDMVNHRFVIEWDSISHNDNTSEPKTEAFQAILLDPAYYETTSGDGEIILQYKKVTVIESMTIGIENNSQDIGLQYVCNENYDPTASVLMVGNAIKFTTEPPYLYIFTGVDENQELSNKLVSGDFRLEQNYPNPFNSRTWIKYSLPDPTDVKLNVYNIRGELVRSLYNGQQSSGEYSVKWNGLDDKGSAVSSGIYFYRLITNDFIETMKMFKLK